MKSPWVADNPSKRWCEQFFLTYSVVWVSALLGVVVPLGLYEVRLQAQLGPRPGCALPSAPLDLLADLSALQGTSVA